MKKLFATFLSVVLTLTVMPMNVQAENNRQENYFDLIDTVIEAETKFGLSGAQLAVMHKGKFIYSEGYGSTNNYQNITKVDGSLDLEGYKVIPMNERVPVTTNTLFDLASNTKMYGLNYAIQKLVQDGKLTLNTKVQDIFEEFVYRGIGEDYQDEITIEDLLMHKAGFTPDPQYHNNNFTGNLGSVEGEGNYLYSQDRELTKEMVLKTPLLYKRGEQHMYSDADFMLLGFIVEEVTGKQLDDYMKETFYEPLGLDNIMFNPLENNVNINNIVASEVHGNTRSGLLDYNNIRKKVVNGEVHDEKAYYSMAGVSGHAGLFGNAEDIAELAYQMVDVENSIFSEATINKFSEGSQLNDTYGVGWRRQGETGRYGWAFSEYASKNTIGHTGWTGTVTIIDPDNELVIALFTNSRNTPRMGEDPNSFFTKNFNTNAYGMISTLVYEALGLGSEKTASQSLVDLFEAELPEDFTTVSISKRNVIRSLISAIEKKSINYEELEQYMNEDIFQETLQLLDENKEEDFDHLSNPESYRIGHQRLDNLYRHVKDYENYDKYSQLSWQRFKQALNIAKLVIEDNTVGQETVNSAYTELKTSLDLLEEKQGWIKEGSDWYYFDEDHVMQTGWVKVDNIWYYMSSSGAMQTGWNKVQHTWYFMSPSGAMQTGWNKVGNTWYFMSPNGAMQTSWNKVGNTWYYMSSTGAMQTGWNKIQHTWYLMSPSGAMQTGWNKVGNTWYLMSPNGAMQKGWNKVGNTWYYMSSTGAMQTGWNKVQYTWYFMSPNGVMQTGWNKVGNTWYYMNPSGAMQTGWLKLGDHWYYLNNNGSMQTQETKINGHWYQFSSSGRMI